MHAGEFVNNTEQTRVDPVTVEHAQAQQPEAARERPVSLFEQTARDIVQEYNEVSGWYAHTEQMYQSVEANIQALDVEFDKMPVNTAASADLSARYRKLVADRDMIRGHVDALRERATKLWMEYAPFQKIAEARTGLQASESALNMGAARRAELQQHEQVLRSEWAGFEATASQESAVIEEEDEQIAQEQRALAQTIDEARERLMQHEYFRPYTENPKYAADYAHVKTFLDQTGAWIQQAESRLKGLGTVREQIHTRRQALNGRREQILSAYNEVMQEQAALVEQMANAEQQWHTSQTQELEGIAQAEEVLRSRSN